MVEKNCIDGIKYETDVKENFLEIRAYTLNGTKIGKLTSEEKLNPSEVDDMFSRFTEYIQNSLEGVCY